MMFRLMASLLFCCVFWLMNFDFYAFSYLAWLARLKTELIWSYLWFNRNSLSSWSWFSLFASIASLCCSLYIAIRFLFSWMWCSSSWARKRACSRFSWAFSAFCVISSKRLSRCSTIRFTANSSSCFNFYFFYYNCNSFGFCTLVFWFVARFLPASSCLRCAIIESTYCLASSICCSFYFTFVFMERYLCFLSASEVPLTISRLIWRSWARC